MEKSIVKIQNMSHKYATQWAVRDINLDVEQKGVIGLLGSNGAGKSTIMNILCGVIKPTEGDVFINGINTKDNPIEAKKYIGFLPQQAPLHSDLTVEEYLTYSASLRDMDPKDIPAAVEAAMEKCALKHFSKRLIKNLSGGYQQRVGIAQAVIHNPALVVLDEPTNGLDPNQTLEIRHLIQELAQERTIILSTHILSEVQASCSLIYMIEEGHLIFSGTMDDFNNYNVPDTLNLSMDNPPAIEELLAIEGVVSVEEAGHNSFKVHYSDSYDITKRIVRMSVQNGWDLTEISIQKASLETVFADLSKKSK